MARFLVLTNMYPPHHLGGYELSCADVVERWRSQGHDVAVLTTTVRLSDVTDPEQEREGLDRAPVWRDLSFYWDDHRLTTPSVWQRLRAERANQRALALALERARPDVVSVWNMGALNLALLGFIRQRGIPIVLNLLDEWLLYERRLDAWTRLWRARPMMAAAVQAGTGVHTRVPDLSESLHCFCSELTRRACAVDPVWPFPRHVITPLGVDRSDFPPLDAVACQERSRRPFNWRLLYVGRIDERKGMSTLVQALAGLPPAAKADFVGRGDESYRAVLVELINQLGLQDRVSFSAVARSQLSERYAQADALVFPSIWDEPFGLVPIEAMACGTPVVATGVGGSAEFLEDGVNCLLFDKGDESSLRDALLRLAEDASLRARLIAGGLATADQLTADHQAERLEQLHLAETALGAPTNRSRQ